VGSCGHGNEPLGGGVNLFTIIKLKN
jgi:hypothetical protein